MFQVCDGDVSRLHQIAHAHELPVDRINRVSVYPYNLGFSGFEIHTDDDVSSTPALHIVCECTHGMEYLRWIPFSFVLYPGNLYSSAKD